MSTPRGFAALLALGAVVGCGAEPPPPRGPVAPNAYALPVVAPKPSSSTPAPSPRNPMSTYRQVYANPERSSRVAAPVVVPSRLERVASFDGKQMGDESYPRFVLPAPSGAFALVDPYRSDSFRVFTAGGTIAAGATVGERLDGHVVSEAGYHDGYVGYPWTDHTNSHDGRANLDLLIDGPRRMRLRAHPGGEQAYPSGDAIASEGSRVYHKRFDGETLGALSATLGAVIVQNDDFKVNILPPPFARPPGAWEPTIVRDFVGGPNEKRAGVSDVSILEGGIALVVDMTRFPEPATERRRRDEPTRPTSVLVLDFEANPIYRIELSWSVAMPVIDAGRGRIAVAGSHLVVYQDGQEAWRLEGGPLLATAFEDGSLAVTRKDELLVLDRDGKELARLRTPATGEFVKERLLPNRPRRPIPPPTPVIDAFTTPPAVAADGSIWAATARHLYVAR